jgi:hypothetical protein
MTTTASPRKFSPATLARHLTGEPGAEVLIGTKTAADILGIKTPNFRRDASPHLHTIEVGGSAPVYFRAEVLDLAAKRAAR